MSKKYGNGKVDPRRMVCAYCLRNECGRCVNIPLLNFGLDILCSCKKEEHK